jgi:predicted RNase H-like HicB family nuclease
MSAKSKNSRSKRVDRPFDPDVLKRAARIAAQYKILVWFENGEYYGHGLEVPGAMNNGKTPDECIANVRDTLMTAVAVMLEDGEVPPPPASEERRTEQINVRLTQEEKLSLDTAAKGLGYTGLSDFVRAAALSAIRR